MIVAGKGGMLLEDDSRNSACFSSTSPPSYNERKPRLINVERNNAKVAAGEGTNFARVPSSTFPPAVSIFFRLIYPRRTFSPMPEDGRGARRFVL